MYDVARGNMLKYKKLEQVSLREVRWGWGFIRTFNKYLVESVPLINFETSEMY